MAINAAPLPLLCHERYNRCEDSPNGHTKPLFQLEGLTKGTRLSDDLQIVVRRFLL